MHTVKTTGKKRMKYAHLNDAARMEMVAADDDHYGKLVSYGKKPQQQEQQPKLNK